MNHKQSYVFLNDKSILIDNEMINLVLLLNLRGYKTSGCCIGNYKTKDYAWVIIQEIDENKIIQLVQNLYGCECQIEKQYYSRENIIYIQCLLKTPDVLYKKRNEIINQLCMNVAGIVEKPTPKLKPLKELFDNM